MSCHRWWAITSTPDRSALQGSSTSFATYAKDRICKGNAIAVAPPVTPQAERGWCKSTIGRGNSPLSYPHSGRHKAIRPAQPQRSATPQDARCRRLPLRCNPWACGATGSQKPMSGSNKARCCSSHCPGERPRALEASARIHRQRHSFGLSVLQAQRSGKGAPAKLASPSDEANKPLLAKDRHQWAVPDSPLNGPTISRVIQPP